MPYPELGQFFHDRDGEGAFFVPGQSALDQGIGDGAFLHRPHQLADVVLARHHHDLGQGKDLAERLEGFGLINLVRGLPRRGQQDEVYEQDRAWPLAENFDARFPIPRRFDRIVISQSLPESGDGGVIG
jgi:hypothetical protein